MSVRLLNRAFSGGELTPEMYSRIDVQKHAEGLALARNFITLPHGPAVNRPGTTYINTTRNGSQQSRLIPFNYSNTQSFAIEVGFGYFRFHAQGAYLSYTVNAGTFSLGGNYTSGDIVVYNGINYQYVQPPGTGINNTPDLSPNWYALPTNPNIYEIANPFTTAINLFDITYTQSADVLTLCHQSVPPIELRRLGAQFWALLKPTFTLPAVQISTITLTANVPTGATNTITYSYVVTGVLFGTNQETLPSTPVAGVNNLATAGASNVLSWSDTSGGMYVRWNVYRLSNGIFGFVGSASGPSPLSFTDNNIIPVVSFTPALSETDATTMVTPSNVSLGFKFAVSTSTSPPLFSTTANYPGAVGYYQQRRIFAGTANNPQRVWATRSGTESDMSYHIPVLSDDRINFRIAAREASAVRHIVPLGDLLLMTPTGEFKVSALGGVLTPSSVNITPNSYIGASNVTPVVVNNVILYGASRGGHLRELSYKLQSQSYISSDISLLAPHLFDYLTISDMAYVRGPTPILWCASSNGKLLGMTYVPEQQIASWHQHDTVAGSVESVCAITEQGQDYLYLIVNRVLNGVQNRYVERMASRLYSTLSGAFFVDCGVTQTFVPPVTTVGGLSWLNGMKVSILADGAVLPQQTVVNGVVTLPQAATVITIGLPITAQLQTLPVTAQTDGGYGTGRVKNVNKVFLRVYRSSGISVGPDFNNLQAYAQRTAEAYGAPPALVSDEVEVVLTPSWDPDGVVCVQQSDPVPIDIVSMTLEVAVGG